MSWLLGIDTSSTELGIALMQGDVPVCTYSRYLRHSHAEHISRAVRFMLESNGIGADAVGRAGVTVGPGSFTGLRIGIAFIKGLFFGRAVRVLPVSSLECIAEAWPGREGTITAALDARNDMVFWARFIRTAGTDGLRRESEDTLSPVATLVSSLPPDGILCTDTLGYAKSTVFRAVRGTCASYELERHPLQRGLAAARIACRNSGDDGRWILPEEIMPRYLHTAYTEDRAHSRQTAGVSR